jgi:light-regulated signal transduction histidine kinase (bacteriophytochrome)
VPLRIVASYTQLLSKRYEGKRNYDADEFIVFAVNGTNHMQRLIQDLQIFPWVEKRESPLLDIPRDQALRQALVNLKHAVEEGGALMTHERLREIRADEVELFQLFQNLVGIAIKC